MKHFTDWYATALRNSITFTAMSLLSVKSYKNECSYSWKYVFFLQFWLCKDILSAKLLNEAFAKRIILKIWSMLRNVLERSTISRKNKTNFGLFIRFFQPSIRSRLCGLRYAAPRQSGGRHLRRVGLRKDGIHQADHAVSGGRQQVAVESHHRTNPRSFAVAGKLRKRQNRTQRQLFPVRKISGSPFQTVRNSKVHARIVRRICGIHFFFRVRVSMLFRQLCTV